MPTFEQRLTALECRSLAGAIMPPVVLFADGIEPTPAQQAQIDEAEAQGRKVICFCREA